MKYTQGLANGMQRVKKKSFQNLYTLRDTLLILLMIIGFLMSFVYHELNWKFLVGKILILGPVIIFYKIILKHRKLSSDR
jgi:hypothetical protein